MKPPSPSRGQLDRLNMERKRARADLLNQVEGTKQTLSPHHLVALWRAQQVRKLGGLGRQVASKVDRNRMTVAGGIVAALALFGLPALWRRWKDRKRNNPAGSDIDTAD